MKKVLIISLLLFPFFGQAQKTSKTFAITYGTGNGDIVSFSTKKDGAMTSTSDNKLNIFGFTFLEELSRNFHFESGISLLHHTYTRTYMYPQGMSTPLPTHHTTNMLTIPVKVRFEFGKYFFVNGGALADISLAGSDNYSSKKTGLGLALGVGLQYYHKNKIGIFFNPQINAHAILSFTGDEGLADDNLTFGIAYRIN